MATQTTEQQNALKDAMERAKQIAAKLQQQSGAPGTESLPTPIQQEDSRKRSFRESLALMNSEQPSKKQAVEGLAVDHTDPKVIAQQVANSLVQRAGLGSTLVEEVTVPNKLVGLVIGRGGEMINRLQSESGARIQVAPDPSPDIAHLYSDRQVTITGVTEAVEKAKQLIDEIKNEGKVPERLLLGGGSGEYSLEVKIAAGKVGLVIGKGGETIKSLQERAGCKMVLFQDGEFSNAPEKPLRISGEQSKVLYGQQLIEDLLVSKELEAMNPEKKEHHEGNAGYAEVEVPREAVGFVIGAKGQSINQLQQSTGCRVQFKNDMEGEFKVASITGKPHQVAMAKQRLLEILQSHADRRGGNWSGPRGPRGSWGHPQGGPGGQFNGPRGPGGWGNSGNQGPRGGWNSGPRGPAHMGGQNTLPPGHKHMVIHVPANRCGLVIGKGGETLKFIHSETKVNIDINREIPDNTPFRSFHVRGSDEMIEKCLEIVREKVGDQSIVAKPSDEQGQTQSDWSGPPQNQQWGQAGQHWGGGAAPAGWGPPQQEQWAQQQSWNQQVGGWNQAAPWNQQGQQQWDPQAQWQQQQQSTWENQWNQQQGYPTDPSQSQAGSQAAPTQTPTSTDAQQSSVTNASAAGGAQQQQDYSAAWALYYQQQQQYYQQFALQQGQAQGAAVGTTESGNGQTPATSTTAAQNQAMADYQAKLAEYYKSFGQQPPQQ